MKDQPPFIAANRRTPSAPRRSYAYNGAGRLVKIDYEQPDVRLSYIGGATSLYDGLDRFGRVMIQKWYDYGASDEVVHHAHGYDRNSNRLYRDDLEISAKDEYYTYDDLNRLVDFDRGVLNGGKTAITTLAYAAGGWVTPPPSESSQPWVPVNKAVRGHFTVRRAVTGEAIH